MKAVSALFAVIALLVSVEASADARIERELARLDAVLAAIDPESLPPDVRPGIDAQRAALARVRTAVATEHQLYLLRDPFVGIETLAWVSTEREARTSVAAFEARWNASRPRFEARPPSARGTLLERGLAESATSRAERLYRASLPYAKAAQPWSGVYYLGEAEGNLRFRAFVSSIAGESALERTPSRAAITATLADLERATLAFFGADIMNRNAIPVSVRIKEARELLDANRLAGAALLAVEARAALSRRSGPGGSYPKGVAAPAGSMLAFLRAWSDAEESPMKEALRGEVTDFYAALFAPAKGAAPKPASVTVTLVRWPYT